MVVPSVVPRTESQQNDLFLLAEDVIVIFLHAGLHSGLDQGLLFSVP